MKVTIPDGVERVVLMIRHSAPPKTGTDANKTLTPDGAMLCQQVAPFYNDLVDQIGDHYGIPSFHCSPFPRSMMTVWEIFCAGNINVEDWLKVWASLLQVDHGAWFEEQRVAGKTEPEMIRTFLLGSHLEKGSFTYYKRNYTAFITGEIGSQENQNSRFAVAVCHEAGISLAAQGYISDEQLGLDKCGAVLFYVAGSVIIGAEKIVPEKQVAQ
jgi:hypothetical protein